MSRSAAPDRPPLSRSEWVDAACRSALAVSVPLIREALDRYGLRLIFLSGSASLGEAVGYDAGDGVPRAVLSDLDLGAVTERPVDAAARARLAEALHRSSDASNGSTPAVSLGCYELRQLTTQVPTLGQTDLAGHALALEGDERLLARMTAPPHEQIPRYEGVRLVGNRALELLDFAESWNEPVVSVRAQHALAKAATSLWTAWLVSERKYATGMAARVALLDAPAARSAPREVVQIARSWAPFLLDPSPRTLPAGIGLLDGYRAALLRLLAEIDRPLDPRFPVRAFLDEPIDARSLVRAWRRARRSRAAERGAAEATAWVVKLVTHALMHGYAPGTPAGRRMAAAASFWLAAPIHARGASAGDRPDLEEAWRESLVRLLGEEIPAGPDALSGLRAQLLPLDV